MFVTLLLSRQTILELLCYAFTLVLIGIKYRVSAGPRATRGPISLRLMHSPAGCRFEKRESVHTDTFMCVFLEVQMKAFLTDHFHYFSGYMFDPSFLRNIKMHFPFKRQLLLFLNHFIKKIVCLTAFWNESLWLVY